MTSLKNVKSKTLLIYPEYNLESKLDDRNLFPPIGVAFLAGYLKSAGYHYVRAEDLRNNSNFKKIDFFRRGSSLDLKNKLSENDELYIAVKKILDKYKPDIVGISMMLFIQQAVTFELMKTIKQINKNIHIVLGGTCVDPDYFKNNGFLLKYFDALILGDGAEPLAQFIAAVDQKKDFKKIPNLFYKVKNMRLASSNLQFIQDKTKLSILDLDGFKFQVIPMLMSSGCYWRKCTFCEDAYGTGDKMRYYLADLDFLTDNIKKLAKKYHNNFFIFFDESIPPLFLEKFSKVLLKKKIKINWIINNACLDNNFLKSSIIKNMKRAGLVSIKFGLESMSPRILKLMKKMHTAETAREIIYKFHQEGVKVGVNVMFGFPTETEKDAKQTIDFLLTNKNILFQILASRFHINKNSYIGHHFEEFEIQSVQPVFNSKKLIFQKKRGIQAEEVEKILNYLKGILKEKIVINEFKFVNPSNYENQKNANKRQG